MTVNTPQNYKYYEKLENIFADRVGRWLSLGDDGPAVMRDSLAWLRGKVGKLRGDYAANADYCRRLRRRLDDRRRAGDAGDDIALGYADLAAREGQNKALGHVIDNYVAHAGRVEDILAGAVGKSYEYCGLFGKSGQPVEVHSLVDGDGVASDARYAGLARCRSIALCPECAGRRLSDWGAAQAKAFRDLKNEGYDIIFITLTAWHNKKLYGPDFADEIDKTFELLKKSYAFVKKWPARGADIGGLSYKKESPYNTTYGYNYHVHAVLAVRGLSGAGITAMMDDFAGVCRRRLRRRGLVSPLNPAYAPGAAGGHDYHWLLVGVNQMDGVAVEHCGKGQGLGWLAEYMSKVERGNWSLAEEMTDWQGRKRGRDWRVVAMFEVLHYLKTGKPSPAIARWLEDNKHLKYMDVMRYWLEVWYVYVLMTQDKQMVGATGKMGALIKKYLGEIKERRKAEKEDAMAALRLRRLYALEDSAMGVLHVSYAAVDFLRAVNLEGRGGQNAGYWALARYGVQVKALHFGDVVRVSDDVGPVVVADKDIPWLSPEFDNVPPLPPLAVGEYIIALPPKCEGYQVAGVVAHDGPQNAILPDGYRWRGDTMVKMTRDEYWQRVGLFNLKFRRRLEDAPLPPEWVEYYRLHPSRA